VPSILQRRISPNIRNRAGQFFGIHVSNHGRVMVFAGGVPLTSGGTVAGGVGVSGGSGEQDHTMAEAGAKAFEILKGANIYGKQSWSGICRAGESRGTADRFSEVIAGLTEVRARRDP
jgi:hypothetical protein